MTSRLARSLLLLVVVFSTPFLHAAEPLPYLADSAPDAVVLLPPPPTPDSAEQQADLETVRRVHNSASPEQLDAAKTEFRLNAFLFARIIGPWFTPESLPRTEAFFDEIGHETHVVLSGGKDFYHRARPFAVDPTIIPLAQEKSFSYPSGHSTGGTVYALVLAELFPEKRDALLEAGKEIGFHRIQAGVHYPSDVYGGRVLGRAIAQAFLKSARFQADLAAVRDELAHAKR